MSNRIPKMGDMVLIFDTETTGIPDQRLPYDRQCQPHLVQLAYILATVGQGIHAQCSVIIRPDGWKIPKGASDIHGITTEAANAYGIPLAAAMSGFAHHVPLAKCLVAHNIQFDLFLVQTALRRIDRPGSARAFAEFDRFCTQEASAPIVNLPPTERMIAAGRTHPKSPRLEEAYQHFAGKPLEGAHDALVDVMACRTVLEAIVARET